MMKFINSALVDICTLVDIYVLINTCTLVDICMHTYKEIY